MTLLLLLRLASVTAALSWEPATCWGDKSCAILMLLPQSATAAFPISLNDVAIGMISGRSEYFDPIKKSILTHAPNGFLLRAPGKCMCSFRFGFKLLRQRVPNVKWYYVGDDDAFINLPNLVRLLSTYDPAKKYVISNRGVWNMNNLCQMKIPGAAQGAFSGGTGQILSAALVHAPEYQETLEKACGPTFLRNETTADEEHTCSLAQIWQQNYIKETLRKRKWQKARLHMAPAFVVAHHLKPSEIATMAHINQHLRQHTRKSMDMELHLPAQCTRWQRSELLESQ